MQQDALLRSSEALVSLANIGHLVANNSLPASVTLAQQTSGLLQHHDAITGTSFNYCTISTSDCDVVTDYLNRLNTSLLQTDVLSGLSKATLLSHGQLPSLAPAAAFPALFSKLNASNAVSVVLSNPLAWVRTEVVSVLLCVAPQRCPAAVRVVDGTGATVPSQIVADPHRGVTQLYFMAKVDALGLVTFFVSLAAIDDADASTVSRARTMTGAFNITNGGLTVAFDARGHSVSVTDDASNSTVPFTVSYAHYTERLPPPVGNIFQGGNAYTFVPDTRPPTDMLATSAAPLLTAAGPLVWQVDLPMNSSLCQSPSACVHTTQLFQQGTDPLAGNTLVLRPRVGTLSAHPTTSGSVVLRVGSAIASGTSFVTDINQHLRRARTYNTSNPIQGNMYPIMGGITVADANRAMAVMPTWPVAGTANNGLVSLLVHRRLIDSDKRCDDDSIVDAPVPVALAAPSVVSATQGATALKSVQPFQAHGLLIPSVAWFLARAASHLDPINAPVDDNVHVLGLRWRPGNGTNVLGVWLQALPGTSGGIVDLNNIHPCGWEATSLDFNLPLSVARGRRMSWRAQAPAVGEDVASRKDDAAAAELSTINVPANAILAFACAV